LAISYYSQVIESKVSDISEKSFNQSRAHLNRSAAYSKLEMFYKSYTDAKESIGPYSTNENKEKAFFRMANAEYMMRNFESTLIHLNECLKINSNNKQAQELLVRANLRINESKTGLYDFEYLAQRGDPSKDDAILRFDVADYKSELIEVTRVRENKMNGVVALKDIKKGTLLVVSKAISKVYDKELIKIHEMITKFNFSSKRASMQSNAQNFSNLIYSMQSNPKAAKEIYELYSGEDYNRNKQSEFLINVERIDAIQRWNSFSSENIFQFFRHANDEERDYNSLLGDKKDNSGLWIFPSYFNHSCIANVTRIFFGDVMMIYALRDIQKSEELTMSYFGYVPDYEIRAERCMYYGFVCDCLLCQLDREEKECDFRKTRSKLVKKIKTNTYFNAANLTKDINKLRDTYRSKSSTKINLSSFERHQLVEPLKKLCSLLKSQNKYDKATDILMEVYTIMEVYGDYIIPVSCLLEAEGIYRCTFKKNEAVLCMKRAQAYFPSNVSYTQYMFSEYDKRSLEYAMKHF
jgi:tetratricopeptide (TPR) repeat protein